MAEKTLNTRIQLKYDTYAHWEASTNVLKAGEVAIATIPASTGAVQGEPAVVIKVGDGTNTFANLPFTSARAADVYAWAKAASKPTYAASEITGLSSYISGQIQDTDTQYKIEQDSSNGKVLKFYSKAKSATTWTLAATITTVDTVYDETALKKRVTDVEGLVGTTAVATQVSTALTNAKSYTDTKTAANATKIDTLIGSDTGKSARAIALEELTKQLVPSTADEALDTLKEIADWIQAHPDDVATMNSAISALQSGKLATTGNASNTTVAFTAATSRANIATGEKLSVIAGKLAKWYTDLKTVAWTGSYADLTNKPTIPTVTNDLTNALKANYDAAYTHSQTAHAPAGAQANIIETIQVNGTAATISDKTVNISVPTGALAGKNSVAEADLASALATKINGKANTSSLAAIATSGNVNALVQTSGDVLVLNCGTATTVF